MRLAMQVLLEELNEAKARDMLGRDYYERSESASMGYRNGYRESEQSGWEGLSALGSAVLRSARSWPWATGPWA